MSLVESKNPSLLSRQNEVLNPMMMSSTADHAVALAAAVLDKRIITAKKFPRSVTAFLTEAKSLITIDVDTARSAEYSKPVGGGKVHGPSVRLTEIACLCWQNIEVEIQEPLIGERSVTVQAFAWDLERNIRMPGIATTSIINKDGGRYPQHLVETTVVATAAKARRNAILAVIPRAYVNELLNEAKQVANKNAKPLDAARQDMLDYFARTYAVQDQQIFSYLNVKGIDDVTQDHIDELRAVVEAIKEGEDVESYFGKPKSKAELAKEKVAQRRGQQSNSEPAATSPIAAPKKPGACPENASARFAEWWKAISAKSDANELRAFCDEAETDDTLSDAEKKLLYAEVTRRLS